ncbi:MAG: serine protease [Leptospirales bacterium]|nr:serine protease [Leptospirales bacterium]
MKKILYILILLLINLSISAETNINKSIVKIYTVTNNYNYDNPWQMGGQANGTGSGSIIDGNRILTNAHVISNNTFLQVKKAGEAKKYTARVDSISHESDLAILRVDDQSFFKNSQALKIGELPQVRDKVAVYGFPTGGDEMSITEGVVSRIEQRNYAHSSANLLTCQIDAAINPGNSGGPVIINNTIVGVAFQSATRGENIGYMVPAPIIKHFLTDISDGKYNGFPELGILFQKMENPDIREKYQMKQNHSGILVIGILHESPAKDIIKIDDIVLSIEGNDIENDGSVEFRPGERTSLNYIVQKKFINDIITIKVLRNGEVKELKVKLTVPINSTRLVPFEQYETAPTYYIAGGLVFAPLTKNYLVEWGNQWFFTAPTKLLDLYQNGLRTEDIKEVVLLTKVLADEINLGYHDIDNVIITKINDKIISAMNDVVDAIENNKGIYHVIEDDTGKKIILRRDQVEKYSSRILQTYRIDSDRSDNLKLKFDR